MNIIGGVLAPDSGAHVPRRRALRAARTPRDAEQRGIAFIHQELNLFTNLSIAENIFIDDSRTGAAAARSDRSAQPCRRARASCWREVDLDLAPDTPVERLSPGERQLVEVAKALQLDAPLIIFDEPTTSLTAARDGAALRADRPAAAGRQDDHLHLAHPRRRDARSPTTSPCCATASLSATGPQPEFDVGRMINLMLGRDIDQLYPAAHLQPRARPSCLRRAACRCAASSRTSASTLRRGEVLGLFGLMGSGRTELARILFGLDHFRLAARSASAASRSHAMTPRRSHRPRMAFITENRREEGLMMNMAIAENIALAALPRFAVTPLRFIDEARLARPPPRVAATLCRSRPVAIDRSRRRASRAATSRRWCIAKWLMSEPAIFILDEPTRGIDVAAKYEIYTIIDRLAADGGGVLFISSEIEELMAMCDRILVMSQGEIVGEFARDGVRQGADPARRVPRRRGGGMTSARRRLTELLLRNATVIIFLAVFLYFGLQAPRFLGLEIVANIVKQASFIGVIAVGMTFVLLTAGIDLSRRLEHVPLGDGGRLPAAESRPCRTARGVVAAILVGLCAGAIFGAVNAFCIVVLRITPFLVTLATLVAGRGLGTAITESFGIEFPGLRHFGASSLFGARTSDGSFSAVPACRIADVLADPVFVVWSLPPTSS